MPQKDNTVGCSSSLYLCPVCKNTLVESSRCFECENRHLFDKAKEGYVNLLLSSDKRSKLPGDNKEMVLARRNFLDKGYYRPLADALCRTVLSLCETAEPAILDAGCGEGYYTGSLSRFLSKNGIQPKIYGVDISKHALMYASKQNKEVSFAVASIFHLPMADASCDFLLNLFSPYQEKEFLRVLKPGGFMLLAIPGPYHLWGLKQALYEHPYPNEPKDYQLENFLFCKEECIEGQIVLSSSEDIHHLFQMTPYYYKTSPKDAGKLLSQKSLTTAISFRLLTYQKLNSTNS